MKRDIFIFVLCFLIVAFSQSYAGDGKPDLAARARQKMSEEYAVRPALGTYRLRMEKIKDGGCELSMPSSFPVDSVIAFYDADGDGYVDMVTRDHYAAGPIPLTLMYRFSPTSRTFEIDDSVMDEDFAAPASAPGCL